jgi:hypothetical protein
MLFGNLIWSRDGAMLFRLKSKDRLDALQARLSRGDARAPDLISEVPAAVEASDEQVARIDSLVQVGALTDAIFALVELAPGAWKLRRLSFDGSEWHCSLSRCLAIPAEFDDAVDGTHEVMQLAILNALIAAPRDDRGVIRSRLHTIPEIRPRTGQPVCCDNFA